MQTLNVTLKFFVVCYKYKYLRPKYMALMNLKVKFEIIFKTLSMTNCIETC